ncbi:hypothetical protein KY336_01830 [Candidatus Woesearchaeota archaeon]|nr:hypothetical protein [Candidatus Woesearchaeota archaeon]
MGGKDPNLELMLSTEEGGMLNILGKTSYRHVDDEPGGSKLTRTDVWFVYDVNSGVIRTFMLRDGAVAREQGEGAGSYRVLIDETLDNPFYNIVQVSVVKRHQGLAQLQESARAYNNSQDVPEDDIRIGRCIDVHNKE